MFQQPANLQQQRQPTALNSKKLKISFENFPSANILSNRIIPQNLRIHYNDGTNNTAPTTLTKLLPNNSRIDEVNKIQQYMPMNLNSAPIGRDFNQNTQREVQNKDEVLAENTFYFNKLMNNTVVLSNFNTAPFQQINSVQPKRLVNEKFIESRNVGEKIAKKNTELNVNNAVTALNSDTSKKNDNSKIRLLTGSTEKIIKWHKVYRNHFCYYELIAPIVSIQEGTVRLQKVLILRDKRGPIIQVVHYVNDHINIESFFVGQTLRCVGHMVGPNMMHGLSIREARPEEIATLNRMCYISEHAITKAISDKS